MTNQQASQMFDAVYYATGCGRPYQHDAEWMAFFGGVADAIIKGIAPKTVLDAGCAWGFLVESLRKRGVEAYGVDISEYAIQHVSPDQQAYCQVGSVLEPFPQRYDLIVNIEVLEHMPPADAEKAVENFCRFSDDILFSSTPFDYKEATHFNVQPPEHWAELFARQGFFRDVDFDASFLTPWAVRYRRKRETLPRLVRDYERKFFLLWKENTDLRSLVVQDRNEIAALTTSLAATGQAGDLVSDLEQRAAALQAQLHEIHNSRSWKLLQVMVGWREKLVPYGSRREAVLQTLHLLKKKP